MKTLLLLVSVTCFGQSAAFEVASVKVHQGPGQTRLTTSGSRFTGEAQLLRNLISWAYDIKHYQVPQIPALTEFDDIFYDVAAKADSDSPPNAEAFREMLRRLLEDRLHLTVHREAREVPVYELIVARNGPRLKESAVGADPTPKYSASGRNYDVSLAKGSVQDLIRIVENSLVDRPVPDRTGLTSFYGIHLMYTPNTNQNRRTPDPEDVSIFTAIQSLGLRLEPRRALLETLIVDHAEKPSGTSRNNAPSDGSHELVMLTKAPVVGMGATPAKKKRA
ncbi:MAG: hypothetical protein JWN34_3003 [Bryobacterales bacterium]|nr:hypothetical protein [Bryobacterales bacterium]